MRRISTLLKMGLFALFIVVAILTVNIAYAKSKDFFLKFNLAQIPGLAIQNTPIAGTNAEGTPLPTSDSAVLSDPVPDPWDGASRVTILVMGLDYTDVRSQEDPGPPKSDTMILLTIDPLTKTAGMLNIPRDLWVNVPGFEYSKLTMAYFLGEAFKVPGGGPALAVQTVENVLGVPIDYYAVIDFSAFEQFIDELGGIYINVPAEIKVDPLGEHNTVVLQPGRQLLDGPVALAYARNRKTANDDFDRSVRQQEVILAIANRILELGPGKLVSKAPALYDKLSAGIHTDLSLDDALKLGWLALDIPLDTVKRGLIAPNSGVIGATSPDGLSIELAVPSQMRMVRDQVFSNTNMASPALSSGDERANMEAEAASIVVANGTYEEGLAAETQTYLKSQGANIIGTQNSDYTDYTRIIDYTGKPYADRYLVNLMGITRYDISYQYDPTSQVDVLIILGNVWASNNPMP